MYQFVQSFPSGKLGNDLGPIIWIIEERFFLLDLKDCLQNRLKFRYFCTQKGFKMSLAWIIFHLNVKMRKSSPKKEQGIKKFTFVQTAVERTILIGWKKQKL